MSIILILFAIIILDLIGYRLTGQPNFPDAILYLLRKRKGKLCSIIINTTNWNTCLETYCKNGKIRYYKNGWQISEKIYNQEMKATCRGIKKEEETI